MTDDPHRSMKRCAECAQRFGADAMFCPFDGSRLVAIEWDPAGDPLVGATIDGRYQVLGVLGEGGMGTVYEVLHTALGRRFAMKVLRKDLASEEELAARFLREARATALVKHPNVVAITDFGRIDDVPYFVMELLVGQTLSQALRFGPMPAARGVKIVLQIAAGLGAAHREHVVHRDLKPENVFLVTRDDGREEVRVVDFGAAMILGASRLTKTGIVFGTPHYMSPEQASGQAVDHRADLYALGVIMYEMFAGKVPFEADTYMGVLTQHMFVNPIPPSEISEAARELGALEAVVLRALEKKPEQRYASMDELAAAIEAVVAFESNGAVTIARARADEGAAASLAPFPMANALELPGADEVRARTSSLAADARRTKARVVAVYAAIALAVAAASLAALRLTVHRAPAEAPAAAPSALAARLPAESIPPVATAAPPSILDASPEPVAPTVAPAAAATVRAAPPLRPTPTHAVAPARARAPHADPPPRAPAFGEPGFKDPWAK